MSEPTDEQGWEPRSCGCCRTRPATPDAPSAERVWVVGEMDYGSSGWHIAGVFGSPAAAEAWIKGNPIKFGYYDVKEHILAISAQEDKK